MLNLMLRFHNDTAYLAEEDCVWFKEECLRFKEKRQKSKDEGQKSFDLKLSSLNLKPHSNLLCDFATFAREKILVIRVIRGKEKKKFCRYMIFS